MASSRLSTPSEGEIVEDSGSEKATKSQPSVNGTSVDRQSRKKRASLSRSPSPSLSPQPTISRVRRHTTRSRSRSPYRAPPPPSSSQRVPKRPRANEEHYGARDDPRNFRVHYEDREHYDPRDAPANGYSYRDTRRGGGGASQGSWNDLNYDDSRHPPGRSREHKRPRTASRSPVRHDSRTYSHHQKRDSGGRPDRSAAHGHGRVGSAPSRDERARHSSQAQSVSENLGRHPSKMNVDTKAEQHNTQTANRDHPAGKTVSFADDISGHDDPDKMEDATTQEPVDEAALIEQRRKRREAIKAKYSGQTPQNLAQALSISNNPTPSDSQPATPLGASLTADTSKLSSAAVSSNNSRQESPATFEVSKDVPMASVEDSTGDDAHGDEPSAADYDPTMDMQEDERRQQLRKNDGELPSSTYDETKDNKQEVLVPATTTAMAAATTRSKDDFDMFAEDGDDMFAETPAQKAEEGEGEPLKAVPVQMGKALDMSMLDDWDDPDGYYRITLGELLDGRYHVQLNLGRGMFSAVVRATDQVTNNAVAIKIIRNNETMRKAALKEIDILRTLNQADPDDKKHVIRLERYFDHKGHLCMVFENLSNNLREILKKFGRDVGINLKAVRAYAQQMFLGLSLLRKCNIIHADIKPDNVLVNESRSQLKICDLGSASDVTENEITPYLVSRFYRAPEIMLGMPYDFAIDTWSIGCTLFELYTGKILFTGRSNNQMLRAIMECRGKISHKALRKAEFAYLHFDEMLNFRSVEKDKLTGKDVVRTLNFTKPTRDLRTRVMANSRRDGNGNGAGDGADGKELNLFVDLLDKCLMLNPEKRCTPAEALRHPFIMRGKF